MERIPEAIFDTLYIGYNIESTLEDFSHYEIQFFAYLSCLLALYEGNPLSFWEYNFVKTLLGSPYSVDIKQAFMFLESNSSLEVSAEGYGRLTKKGKDEMGFYLELYTFKQRSVYLDAACNSLSLIPISSIKEAIYNEPVLKSARSVTRKYLLDEKSPATQVLYEQFGILRHALKDEQYKTLIIPAVVWLESLKAKSETEELA